jgi:hypothetical protein
MSKKYFALTLLVDQSGKSKKHLYSQEFDKIREIL